MNRRNRATISSTAGTTGGLARMLNRPRGAGAAIRASRARSH